MIRKATVSDAEDIAKLAIQMWESHTVGELAEEFADLLANEKAAVFLCCEDDSAVGVAQCQLRHDYGEGTDSSPVGYPEGVFVDTQYRKRGFGKALVDACENWAKEQGCTEFASDCELDNTASLAFHLKMGFEEASRNIHFAKKIGG